MSVPDETNPRYYTIVISRCCHELVDLMQTKTIKG